MRSPIDTSPFDTRFKKIARAATSGLAHRLGYRIEKLEDTDTFVDDHRSSMTPEVMTRIASIPGMITLRRAMYLYLLAYSCGADGDIIEIGSWQGRSTACLAQGCADADAGRVHAIDTFEGNPGHEENYAVDGVVSLEQGFRNNMARVGLAERVVTYPKSAVAAAPEVRAAVKQARIICIDGEHTYDAVSEELRLYADLLAARGLLIFDDYSSAFEGVARAINEHIDTNPDRYARPVQDRNLLVLRRLQ